MVKHKLGVIVPYRHRETQLSIFLNHITNYLDKYDIDYHIIVVDQDDAKQFNRGMLLNIGFKYAKQMRCDYVVYHDVDMLPVDVDYSYSETPLHLATDFILEDGEKKREIFQEYFGGVTMFTTEIFKKINGYSNKYWGWGYEDTDLLFRCKVKNVDLDTYKTRNIGRKGKALKFNGVNSYVECKNIINLNNNATFFINFYPEENVLDHTKNSDEFTVFSIPGWDFAICYNSFSRYNFCAFDTEHNAYYINSEIKPRYKTTIVVVLDKNENIIKLYQDGVFVGQSEKFKRLYFYKKEPNFYLGAGKPGREKIPNHFKGTICSFAYFDDILGDDEILEISTNEKNSLMKSFGNYKSKESLKLYFDANVIEFYTLLDITNSGIEGKIVDCEIIDEVYDEYSEIKIPHRRNGLFKSLKHEENGFTGYSWKDHATRWNQLRFHNEIFYNNNLIDEDGLSNLKYTEHGKTRDNNITRINVGI
jgi:hypothetical protein